LKQCVKENFYEKDEDHGWNLFEDLAEKALQWESCSDKSKNQNPISPKTGLHSIESLIAIKAKISHLMIRLELLEAKEESMVNQVNPPQMLNLGCSYCHALNHIFEECPVFLAQQMLLDNMNATFARPNNNLYSKTYNLGWRNHPNFS